MKKDFVTTSLLTLMSFQSIQSLIPPAFAQSPNVVVTNANANGAALSSNSSPVTQANQPPGAGSIATGQVAASSVATLIAAARTGVAGTGRVSLTVCNTSAVAVYLGSSTVTSSLGQLLAGVAGACVTLNYTGALYGTTGSSISATVAYSETF